MLLNENLFSDEIINIETPSAETSITVDPKLEGPTTEDEIGESSLILSAISNCANMINEYNCMKVNLKNPKMVEVAGDISNEANIIMGKLQSMLKEVSPNAENIMNGAAQTEQELTEDLNEDNTIPKDIKNILLKHGFKYYH